MNLKKSRRKMLMLGVVACLLLALSGTTGISTAADSVLYAKPSAIGSGDCSDWDNACTLQTALGLAGAGDEIWVAFGTHIPTDGTDRTATFQLKNGVGVYGGFVGTETTREARDWMVHETILSGDIGEVGDNSDNSYHVVTGSGTDGTAVLDGFTITGGNANGGAWPDYRGGGMMNTFSSPSLFNVTFSGNSAHGGGGMYNFESSPTLTNVTFGNNLAYGGGGMFNEGGSSPTLTNVSFSGNSAEHYGGGMFNQTYSSPTLTNVTFSDNSADEYGGGMFNISYSSPTLTNVTFSGNSANDWGGGIWNSWYSSPTLANVTFTGNSAGGEGGGMYNRQYSSPTLTNVTFSGNSAVLGGGIYNDYGSPTLTDVTFSDNSADHGGGGMHSSYSNPTLINVTFSGNSADYGGGMIHWWGTGATLVNVIFSGNSASYGPGGGMYNNYSNPTLINVTFSSNFADEYGGGMYNAGSSPTLVNVTFSGNFTYSYGGGMVNSWYSNPTLTNVTFTGNSSFWGGGIENHQHSSPTLTNSILWGNTAYAGGQIYNEEGSTSTISYSLVEGSGGSGPGWDTSLGTDEGGNIDANPQFVDAPNGDLHLQATSPAIDAGDNDALPADTLDLDGDGDTTEELPFDLDGHPRIVNGIVDMGAYEVQMASVVNECVQALPDVAFANPAIAAQMKNALENKLLDDPDSVFNLIEGGMIQDAIDKLNYDIRPKADGSLGGNPANDWITDPTAQAELADMIDALVAYLETLL